MTTRFRQLPPIDPDTEEIITLSKAARDVKPNGVSMPTFSRWLQHGVRISGTDERVKPATILIGGRRMTSVEAMSNLFDAQQNAGTSAPSITPSQRRKQAETADRLLQEAGI